MPIMPGQVFTAHDLRKIEATTLEIGRHMLEKSKKQSPSVLHKRWWEDRIMSWAMSDDSVKVQMFRFIDVLPMLDSSESVVRHLKEYFDEVRQHLPTAVRLGLAMASPRSITGRAVSAAARRQAMSHARRFIAGANSREVLAAALRERKARRCFTLDLLGEAVTSGVEADRYVEQYVSLINEIAPVVNRWEEIPQIDRDGITAIPRVNVSLKLSSLDPHFEPVDPEGSGARVKHRLRRLLRAARGHRAYVHVDMESYKIKDLTLRIFKEILMEDEFRDYADVGIVIQCYLRDAEQDLESLAEWAERRGTSVWVRLVKGAYWDYESAWANNQGWPIPVFLRKWESDANFEKLTRQLMSRHKVLKTALASHNLRSLANGIATARHLGLAPSAYEIQMLYGMGDSEKQSLVDLGHRLRIYMPFGDLIPGMAYLVRRLLENTSNESFLKATFAEQLTAEELLKNPLQHREVESLPMTTQNSTSRPVEAPFLNEPPTDFSREENRRAMQRALEAVREELGQHYCLFVDGEDREGDEQLVSRDPSCHEVIVGTTAAASSADAADAVRAASSAWPAWHAAGVQARARALRQLAAEMRNRRFELAAWITLETGKGWIEADADVAEAIDFCEFYARDALALQGEHGYDLPGEENRFDYLPQGVAAVIAPWNFPLAILTGMTAAALVTGNAVIMKPAEQSPVVAAQLFRMLRDLEMPPNVVQFLPGAGEIVGAALVEHPEVGVIAFTGSRDVGLKIHQRAAEISSRNHHGVKRVIAEMGGKNGIIIDADADLDEAVIGVIQSAFGYQGQKCSACSRVIVLNQVYDAFVPRLIEATKCLKIGPASEPGNNIGPLIDEVAVSRVRQYIEIGKQEGTLILGLGAGEIEQAGYFVGPHIFANIQPTARLAREEIFGPVLAVLKASDFTEALKIANETEYGLTGGIYSRSPANLARAKREFRVGNLYLNRAITGALVCRQPFGGFKMSGIGTKAGGHQYLLQFVVPRTITENTMRRGFAPDTLRNRREF